MREKLADLCHKQWAGWMEYLFSKCFPEIGYFDHGIEHLVIPKWAVTRWKRQMLTSYSELPETEKESDRKEADRFLALFATESLEKGDISGRVKQLQEIIHKNAVNHGWWEIKRPIPEVLCLIHSEVSEALEAFRDGNKENFAEELADIAIRLLDAAEGYGIDLEAEILKKHERNKHREYKHGGKAC